MLRGQFQVNLLTFVLREWFRFIADVRISPLTVVALQQQGYDTPRVTAPCNSG